MTHSAHTAQVGASNWKQKETNKQAKQDTGTAHRALSVARGDFDPAEQLHPAHHTARVHRKEVRFVVVLVFNL